MRRFIFSLFICVSVLATEPIYFYWKTKNVIFEGCKCGGHPCSGFLYEETSKAGHWLRLAQSVIDYVGMKGRVKILWKIGHYSQQANPGTWLKFGRREVKIPEDEDDLNFLKALLRVIGKRENPQKLLWRFPDYSSPSLSLDGKILAYRIWQGGKAKVVVEDLRRKIIWKWKPTQNEEVILTDPFLSPSGKILTFLVGKEGLMDYKLYIKELWENRFYKCQIPSPKTGKDEIILYSTPFVYPSDKYILCGWSFVDFKHNSEEPCVILFFYQNEKMVYSLLLHLPGILNFSWSPDQEKLLVMLEKQKRNLGELLPKAKYYKEFLLIDVPKRKVYKHNLLPAHYTFVWDKNGMGIFFATKGRNKGEIFFFSLKNGKLSKLYECSESLEIFALLNDGTLVLKRGKDKLFFFSQGIKNKEVKAIFQRYFINQSPLVSVEYHYDWEGYYREGPFPTNCLEIGLVEEPLFEKQGIFVYPNSLIGDIVLFTKLVMPKAYYERLKKIIEKHPIYWDVHPNRFVVWLDSRNCGCAKLNVSPL
jgi:hypothetical protein